MGNAFGGRAGAPQTIQVHGMQSHSHVPSNIRKQSTYDLLPATSDSTAVGVPALDDQLLMPSVGICKIPTGICGPLPKNTVGLMIGRSSLTIKGIQVHVGITEDFEGEIHVMKSTNIPYPIKERPNYTTPSLALHKD